MAVKVLKVNLDPPATFPTVPRAFHAISTSLKEFIISCETAQRHQHGGVKLGVGGNGVKLKIARGKSAKRVVTGSEGMKVARCVWNLAKSLIIFF